MAPRSSRAKAPTPAEHRGRLGLTVAEAARAADVAKQTLLKVEDGDRTVTVRTLRRLAAFYDVRLGDFIDGWERAGAPS